MSDTDTSQVGSGQVGGLQVGSGGDGQSVSMRAGRSILISHGAGGGLVRGQVIGGGSTSWRGMSIVIAHGGTAVALKKTARNLSVLVNGVDRTAWVEPGVRRSAVVGSRTQCSFTMNATHGRADYRPQKFDSVLIYVGTYRWFCGIVDSYDEDAESGTSGYYKITVRCLDFGAALDACYIGRHYEIFDGALLFIIMADLCIKYFTPRFGITFGGQGDGWTQADVIQPFDINWDTGTQVVTKLAQQFNLDWFVDQWKVLRLFSQANGLNDTPFSIETNNHLWKRLVVTRGMFYANRVGARNSQDLGAIWTDTYTAEAGQPEFIATAALKQRPAVKVNGAFETVTDAGEYSQPWKWYWLPFLVVRNPDYPLSAGDIVEILYPSGISFVSWVQDDAEIAAHGTWEYLVEVKGILSRDQLRQVAQGELEKRKADAASITLETDEIGIEPGMVLPVDTVAPPVSGRFLVEQVDSVEVGKGGASARESRTAPVKGYFQHVVRASNSKLQRRGSGAALGQRLQDMAAQAKDRQTFEIAFLLAETIVGVENPGLQAGIYTIPDFALRAGVAKQCSLYFQSSTEVLTDTKIDVDMEMNDVSIFPPGTDTRMTWKAGETVMQVNFIFADDPFDVPVGAKFRAVALLADAKAKDGVIKLEIQG